ncbi:MAG: NAD(P)H-dependent oxidoreductase [Saprospiraceae bacterium]|nr:NAD(P)H-dependent oxidoreductase [Saprospiraceae bacterium]
MSNLLDALNWRYAIKKFDANKKVDPATVDQLLEAVRLAATSYGLQPFQILHIKDADLRAKLRGASWNQSQITDASDMFVFCPYAEFKEEHITEYVKLIMATRGVDREVLAGFEGMMKGLLQSPKEVLAQWSAKQAYIAMGHLLVAAADAQVDTCPMEGFEAAQYNEILGLAERNLSAAVVVTIGYRSEEDGLQHAAKVRKPKETLVVEL